MKKKYEDMTPQEQFEFRTSDSSGTIFNGVLYLDGDDDQSEPEKPTTSRQRMIDKIIAKRQK